MKPAAIVSDFSWGHVSLLPSAPYSIRDESRLWVLGLAFERQQGVHSVGGGRRQDFDAWPGELAVTSPDVEIFSESGNGGEYLALHARCVVPSLETEILRAAPRAVLRGDRRATQLGKQLRHLMLSSHPDQQRIDEQAMLLLDHGLSLLALPRRSPGGYNHDLPAHSRVLEYVDDALDRPLRLDEMARVAGMPLMRFLRSFTSAVGCTPHGYITERRMQRARVLLSTTDNSIADIAAICGFAHQSHLGAVLKDRLGMSPRRYRARGRRA